MAVIDQERPAPAAAAPCCENARIPPLAALARAIGGPVRWMSSRSSGLVRRVIVRAHRELIGDVWVQVTHKAPGCNSFQILVSPQDHCGGHLYYRGGYEPSQTAAFVGLLREIAPRAFVDIGANIGYYTLLAAANGADEVVAVEASPAIVPMLKKSVAANSALSPKIRVVAAAASDREGEISFWVSRVKHNFGVGSVIGSPMNTGEEVTVPCFPADSFLSDIGAGPVLCKIDVEGAEMMVLNGMARTIDQLRPVFLVEVHPVELSRMGLGKEQVVEFLLARGYRLAELQGEREIALAAHSTLPSDNFYLIARPAA